MLDKIHPKLNEQKIILEEAIRKAITESVSHFEGQTGVYITNIKCTYHKDQKMIKNDVDAECSLLLDKGIH